MMSSFSASAGTEGGVRKRMKRDHEPDEEEGMASK
jgi:hypothetical protein